MGEDFDLWVRIAKKYHVILEDTLVEGNNQSRYIIKGIQNCIQLNQFIANIFTYKNNLKYFYCDYKGENNHLYVWEFTTRPHEKVIFNNLNPEDELICQISLDGSGNVKLIETIFTNNSRLNKHFFSYVLKTNYKTINGQLIANYSDLKLLPNVYLDDMQRTYQIAFSDIQFKK